MIISIMNLKDYDESSEIWKSTKETGLRSLDDSRIGIEKFLKRNPNTNFICRMHNRLVGTILCGHDGRRGYIYHAAVLKEYRNQGIGKKLVAHVIEALKKEGINKVALVVFKDNKLGNKFWDSVAFEEREDLVYRNRSINPLNV